MTNTYILKNVIEKSAGVVTSNW